MGRGQRIWTSEVPDESLTLSPWVKGSPIQPLPVVTQQKVWFDFCMDIGRTYRSDYDVIGQCVATMATSCTEAAGQAMMAKAVHQYSTDT